MAQISHTKIKQPSFGEKRPKLTNTKISRFTVDVCQQEQLDTVWNQQDLSQGESLNVHCW